MSSLGASAAGTVLDGHAWTPCLKDWGERSISIFSSGELQPATVSHGDVVFLVSSDFDNQAWAGLSFDGRPVEMWIGEDGADFSEYEQVFAGSCGALARNGLECTLGLAGPDAKIAKDLLSLTYTGAGALDGDPEIKGSLKPWCSGEAKNISGVLINENYWVYQYHAYGPTGGVQGVYENAWPVAANASATVDSYGALINLDLQPGQWAHCPKEGLYRLGGQPSGLITADVVGATVNGSPVLTVGEIVRHLLSTRVDADEIDAATFAPFTQAWSLYVDAQVSVGDQVREGMRQAGGYLLPDQSGKWIAGDFYGEGTAGELRGDRTSEPLVESYSQLASAPPAYRIKVGHDRSWTVHSDDQISPLLLDITDEEARAAAADAAAKAAAAEQKADTAIGKVDEVADDLETVKETVDQTVIDLAKLDQDVVTAREIADDLVETYGNTVSSKANADAAAQHEANVAAASGVIQQIKADTQAIFEQASEKADDSEASRHASEAAKAASELARDQAQAFASNSDGSSQASAGHAQTAISAKDQASNYASAAQASAVAAKATVAALLPTDFADGWTYWAAEWSTGTGTPLPEWSLVDNSYGRVARLTNPSGLMRDIANVGRIPVVAGRKLRVTVKWRVLDSMGQTPEIELYRIGIPGAAGGQFNNSSGVGHIAAGAPGWGDNNGWATASYDINTDDFVLNDPRSAYMRVLVRFTRAGLYEIQSIRLDDVTSEHAAKTWAEAAAQSQSAASISENKAGQSATASEQSSTNAATHEKAAWDHRVAAAGHENTAGQYRSDAETFRNQASNSATDSAGSAATANDRAGVATNAADRAGNSANSAASSESNSAAYADASQRSAVASENSRLSASTAAQSMMPADFGDIRNWTWDYAGGASDWSSDGRARAYDHGTLGRILEINNNPAFSPHIAAKGRVNLVRDHVYRITAKWHLVGQQPNENPQGASIFAIGLRPDGTTYNSLAVAVSVAPGQPGWGSSGWATHVLEVNANTLLDQGCTWFRPLFRLDAQGVYDIQSIDTRDVTGEIIAKGHADAAAESEREIVAIQSDVTQKAGAVEQNRVRAETARADAEGFRNQTATSESNVNQALSTATQQAGISASAAKTAQNRATGNIVSRGEFDAASGKGDWTGATGVYYANDIGQYILSQNDRDSYDGETIAGNWSNRRFRVSGEVQAWGSYQAQIGIHCVNNAGGNEWYIQGVANAGSWYTPFSFELLLPANVKAARAVLVSDGPSGASGHGVNWRSIRIEDITSENASKASAQASADNAAVATAKADEAGQHASASQSSEVRATTAADAVDKTFANSFPNFVGPVGKSAYVYLGDDGTGFQFDYGPGSGWPQPYITAQAGGRGGRYNRISFKESIPKSVGRRYRVRAWFYSNATNCQTVALWALGTDNNNWDASAVGYSSEAAPAGTVNNVAINAPGFTEFGAEFTVSDAWKPFWKPIFEFVTTGGAPNALWHMTGLTIEDITSEKAAKDSADAASTAYSNAQIEAGKAGNSATASSGSADRAEVANSDSQAAARAAQGSAADANRDAASAANSVSLVATYSTGGGNLIPETSFAAGTAGWNFYSPSGSTPFERGVDISGDAWRPTNEHTLVIRQINGNSTDWAQWHTDQIAVEANKWYEFSAYIAAHRCQAYIRVDWLDANGTGIRSDYNVSSNFDAEKGGTNLDSWKRCWAKVQAPSNAARAHVVLVKDPTIQSMGYGDSYAFYTHPMLRQTYAEAAGPSPYAAGNGSTTQAAQQASITQNSTAIATTNSTLANLTTVVQSGSPNLLRNGGFNNGMAYWYVTHGGWNPHVSGGWGQITDRGGDWSGPHTFIDSERVPIFGGTAYTLSADSLYILASGSGHCYTEIVWFDSAGNSIYSVAGNPNYASHDYSPTDVGRNIHKLTATSPSNATQAVARLVHYKADGSSATVIGWRQVKLEQGSVMTAYSNEAAVTMISETVTSVDGKANQALARAAVQLDVNGYVSGWEMANNGQTGAMTINADRFQIVRPGGGPRTEYRNGLWIVTDGSSWMSIWGGAFGSGNRFMRWTGPYFTDLNNCNEANAKEYLRVDGTAYFGGALLAGTLRNSGASSATAANASTTTGAFGSNGGQVTVNTSWVYSYDVTSTYAATAQGRQQYDAALAAFGSAGSGDGGLTHQGSKTETMSAAEIVLNLRKNGGLVASQGGGSKIVSLDGVRPTIGDSGGRITWTYSHSSSFTHVDDERSTAARTFSADITRNLSTGNNPSQRVSVVCVE
ncbi:MAG: hypothetical protein DI554_00495 [Sphingobium sp.]|nr:MAG: hypothetical protein DI554_00495 [Sphingobium sp.]